ncbi:beta-phosphoglucomutase [Flavobacteriales bacterium]|jgi:beta-phosphoglucomutase|nr:beta-phosphoglucomutase [Flavobacteriales bacterium]MDA9864353.1 beta-phosphoglucomutase [Flavobacteriales bacterium]
MAFTPKACLFDLDGVIVDTAKYHFTGWKRLADELGIPYTQEDNEQLKGVSRVGSLEYILQKGGLVLDNDTKVRLMDRKNSQYLELVETMTSRELFPGVVEFIDELIAAGIKVGLGSSSRNAPLILDLCGIADRFEVVVDGNSITFSKPDPEVFLKGAQYFGFAPQDCVVFEDAVSGIQAALNGKFRAVGVGHPQNLPQAEVVIPNFEGYSLSKLEQHLS